MRMSEDNPRLGLRQEKRAKVRIGDAASDVSLMIRIFVLLSFKPSCARFTRPHLLSGLSFPLPLEGERPTLLLLVLGAGELLLVPLADDCMRRMSSFC